MLENTIQLLGGFGGIFPPMLLSYMAMTRYVETTRGVKPVQGLRLAFQVVQSRAPVIVEVRGRDIEVL